MKTIPYEDYRRKLLGCWVGKSVGGTLGGPYEGRPGPLNLSFYDPVPTEMLPNDDLDLQVVWMEVIRRRGLPVNRYHLAGAWLDNVHLWPDEYGVATRNLIHGVYPPAAGAFDNKFTAGMGAAIRSELWACLAPGDPQLAVRLAREDACVDHDGEGLHAAVFLTALESLAFTENDREVLLERALEFIPKNSRLAAGIGDTRRWWQEAGETGRGSTDRHLVRDRIIREHAPQNWTDVVPNLCFIVLGWLEGRGDFGRSICTAVNCGLDTDCTGATLGALLGILSPDSIGDEWASPIGRDLVLSPGMVGMHHPATLDEFSDHVAEAAVNVLDYYASAVEITGSSFYAHTLGRWSITPEVVETRSEAPVRDALVATEPLAVSVLYSQNIAFLPQEQSEVKMVVANPGSEAVTAVAKMSVPDGWSVTPAEWKLSLAPGACADFALQVTPPGPQAVRSYHNMLDIRFTAGALSWTVSAGLPQSIPWTRMPATSSLSSGPDKGSDNDDSKPKQEPVEAACHFQTIPPGAWTYETEVKIPFRGTFIFVTQGGRPAVTYLNGEPINRYDGSFYVPAMHRSKTGSEVQCNRGWHRVRIDIADGDESELFFGIGVRASFGWITELEWRLPVGE